jgi:hypothetical protein
VTKTQNPRVAAILWFFASALFLTATVLNYSKEGAIKWTLLAATLFMAAMGITTLRRTEPGER